MYAATVSSYKKINMFGAGRHMPCQYIATPTFYTEPGRTLAACEAGCLANLLCKEEMLSRVLPVLLLFMLVASQQRKQHVLTFI